jgi:flagellar protein FlbD
MISVTRFDHTVVVVNAELIVMVERTPDTLITLTNGHMIVVTESVDEIVARVIDYRRQINSGVRVIADKEAEPQGKV